MTGYELLENELKNDFTVTKIKQNKPFIEAIVKILAGEDAAKVALSLADEKMKEAEKIRGECEAVRRSAENMLLKLNRRWGEIQTEAMILTGKENELKELEETLNALETPEARDKMRMAHYYEKHTHADVTTLARGLSNILGNGGVKKTEIKDE